MGRSLARMRLVRRREPPAKPPPLDCRWMFPLPRQSRCAQERNSIYIRFWIRQHDGSYGFTDETKSSSHESYLS